MNHPPGSALTDLALGLSGEDALRTHVRDCAACAEELHRIAERHAELERSYGALEPPSTEAVEAKVLRAVHASALQAPPRPFSARAFALIAASVVVCAAIGWSVLPRSPKPKPAAPPARPPVQEEIPKEEVAARINGKVLTWKQVLDALKGIKPEDVTQELRESKRRELAEAMLFLQFAERKKLKVSEEELDQTLERDMKTYGSREEYEKVVRLRYGTQTKAGESRREELLVYHLYRYAFQNMNVDPELKDAGFALDDVPEGELRKYYEANPGHFQASERISFIRVALQFLNPGEEETKRAIAESILRKYEKGSEFVMMAFFYSDLRRAKDFRDMNVSRKDLEGFYSAETIAFLFDTLKEKEVSPIIKDGKTINLFRMEQKIVQKAESFEEAQGRIRSMLQNQIRENNRKKLRDLIRRQARLEPPDLFEEK